MNLPSTQNIYYKKLNGYRCDHRNKWYLVSEKILTLSELALFDFYIDISDFDTKHTTFGMFEVDFLCISQIFNCSQSSIRYRHNRLMALNLVSKISRRNFFVVTNPKRYTPPGVWKGEASDYSKREKSQPVEKIFQSIGINFQPTEEKVQRTENNASHPLKESSTKALGSFKGESRFNNASTLPLEDIEWILCHVDEKK